MNIVAGVARMFFEKWPDYRELDLLAVDLELTSLDPRRGAIVSIGYAALERGEIVPAKGRHLLISDHHGVGGSAAFHGIRDCDRQRGIPLAEALRQLRTAAGSKPLIFHHAGLDIRFLKNAGLNLERHSVIDTLQLERRRLLRRQTFAGNNQLRLYQCCERYHLPVRKAHNAFTDALATAELFLAQAAHMSGGGSLTLKELTCRSFISRTL